MLQLSTVEGSKPSNTFKPDRTPRQGLDIVSECGEASLRHGMHFSCDSPLTMHSARNVRGCEQFKNASFHDAVAHSHGLHAHASKKRVRTIASVWSRASACLAARLSNALCAPSHVARGNMHISTLLSTFQKRKRCTASIHLDGPRCLRTGLGNLACSSRDRLDYLACSQHPA